MLAGQQKRAATEPLIAWRETIQTAESLLIGGLQMLINRIESLLSRCSVDSEQVGEQFLYKSLKGHDYQGLSEVSRGYPQGDPRHL